MYIGKATASQIKKYRKNYSKLNLDRTYTRYVFADKKLPLQDGDNKYFEIVEFDNLGLPYAIVIGANPAKGIIDVFDATNFYIANNLKKQNKYSGYLLLNIYSVLTPTVQQLNKYVKKNNLNSCENMILQFLSIMKNSDIYICWGHNISGLTAKYKCLLPRKLVLYIKTQVKRGATNFYYSADSSNHIIHPCKGNFVFQPLAMNTIKEIYW